MNPSCKETLFALAVESTVDTRMEGVRRNDHALRASIEQMNKIGHQWRQPKKLILRSKKNEYK